MHAHAPDWSRATYDSVRGFMRSGSDESDGYPFRVPCICCAAEGTATVTTVGGDETVEWEDAE